MPFMHAQRSVSIFILTCFIPMLTQAFSPSSPLRIGATGEDVRELQTILASLGYFSHPSTGYFGSITEAAVRAFQADRGIAQSGNPGTTGFGIVGPRTAAALTLPNPSTEQTTTDASSRFTRSLQPGMYGEDVRALQIFLNTAGFRVSETGLGSPGFETSFFGAGTASALMRFQASRGIPALGIFGPRTRTIVAEQNATSSSPKAPSPQTPTPEYFKPNNRGSSNNYATSTSDSITVDNSAPMISSIASSTGEFTATISWTTDEAASSRVDYGSTDSYGSSSSTSALTTSHSISLTGLTAATTYHFRAQSTDAAGNIATSSDYTFSTTGYQGLVGTRARTMATANAGNTRVMSRSAHIATDAISSMRVVFQNFRVSGILADETGNGASSTVTASVEYPSGTFTQITFDGSATGTIPNASVLFSDATAVSIPEGATFWIREFNINANGIIYNTWRNSSLGEVLNAGTSIGDQTLGGTITSVGNFSHPPLAIIASTTKASVCIVGDSIAFGFNDTDTHVDGRIGIIAKSFPTTLAFSNLSSGGSRANSFLAGSSARQQIFPYCSHAITSFGSNDLFVSLDTASELASSLQTIWDTFASRVKKIQTTITPKSTSTDSWATTGNQTTASQNGERVTFNTNLRASAFGLHDYFEVANVLETAQNSGLWVNDGTPNRYTADGLHPSTAGYTLVASSSAIELSSLEYPF